MRACAPILSLRYPEPALLLKEIEENDLAHELFGKVHATDTFRLEFFSDGPVFGGELLELSFDITKQRSVLLEELPCDGFDTEGVFELCERREFFGVLK